MSGGTFERQHERKRLQATRLRDVKALPSQADGAPRRVERRPHRNARRSLLASVLAAAEKLGHAEGSEATAALGGAQLAQQALRLYRAGKRELRTDSPVALSHLLAWALQTSAAQHLTIAAAEAGIGTDVGLRLLEQGARCQGRAERSNTAAVVMAGLLDGNRGSGPSDNAALAELMREAAKPRGTP